MTRDTLRRVRSVLIAPAVRADFIAKLPTRGADVLFLDCEDAVPANAKEEARRLARRSVPDLVAVGCEVVVRCNPVDSQWFDSDISDGLAPEVSAVVIPKIERLAQLDRAADVLERSGLGHVGIFVGIETVLGVVDARPLLAHPSVSAAYFGAEDFIADIGGVRTTSNDEVAVARAQVAMAARLAEVTLVDQVVTNFRDDERFVREAVEARNMGYDGKLCIHPAQVEPAHRAFTPSSEEVERAHRLLVAYEESVAGGLAAIEFEGQMVDEPLAMQARRLIERASPEPSKPRPVPGDEDPE